MAVNGLPPLGRYGPVPEHTRLSGITQPVSSRLDEYDLVFSIANILISAGVIRFAESCQRG